ncbi:hypothetical protein [Burkholderia ubonensis]|uniref:hypothetical protein n=1 Tax=Burkholderia ubonensis TaxID=101571 RepID=UPI001E4F7566|nr:hypothetical protein [Burkholderia ubonensis]
MEADERAAHDAFVAQRARERGRQVVQFRICQPPGFIGGGNVMRVFARTLAERMMQRANIRTMPLRHAAILSYRFGNLHGDPLFNGLRIARAGDRFKRRSVDLTIAAARCLSQKSGTVAARRAGFGDLRFAGCPGYPLQTHARPGV